MCVNTTLNSQFLLIKNIVRVHCDAGFFEMHCVEMTVKDNPIFEQIKKPSMDPQENEENPTPIQDFFANTTIFITGGTGFLGILLLEKLLVSCPKISKVYMLIRSKRGKEIQSRMDELFEDAVFYRLKEQCPDFREKIWPVEGDCEMTGLGLNFQDISMLTKEVNVIFHVAATVRFDETLKKASFINVRALRDILRLAHQMPNLKSFLHVSTAYSNYIHKVIKEEIYPPSMDYRKLLNVTESLDDEILSMITPTLVGGYPNTYAFTKQVGEDVVKQEGKGLPVGIHRPAIVMSTYKEPLKGWINSVYNIAGIGVSVGIGLVKILELAKNCKANAVPADMCINSIIASAWDVGRRFAEKEKGDHQEIPVYSFDADQGPPLSWKKYGELGIKYTLLFPTIRSLWYPIWVTCESHALYVVATFLVHTIPAFILDIFLFCRCKKPRMMKIYQKLHKFIALLTRFNKSNWEFESKNMRAVISKMSRGDQKLFYCDLKDLDWEEYFESYVKGLRTFIVKDPLDTVPQGKKIMRRLYWQHVLVSTTAVGFSLWMMYNIFSLVLNITF